MKNILVVDNNTMFLEYMREILSAEDYAVTTAAGGLEALDYLQDSVPDLIFVDLVMPQIDGIRLCKIIKSRPALQNASVVIISATAAEDEGFRYSCIADAYVAKMPFKKMKGPVLKLLSDFEAGRGEQYKDKIVGVDQIYRRNITEELLYAKQHLDVLLSGMSDGFIEVTPDYRITYVNRPAVEMSGVAEEDLLFSSFPELFPQDVRPRVEAVLREAESGKQEIGEDGPVVLNNRYLSMRFLPVEFRDRRAITVVMQDITERKRAENLMEESLRNKDVMLKEIHHRVKNNLQVVASLLSLQASCVSDETISNYFKDSENRVNVMALIHEQLYEQEDLSEINLKHYFEELVAQLVKTYTSDDTIVRSSVTAPPLQLPVQTAIPLGLIVNETVTNSLVHGLSEKKEGRVDVAVREDADSRLQLSVTDDGNGMPADFDIDTADSLGLSLVCSLASQIGGTFSFGNAKTAQEDGRPGTAVTVSFPKPGGTNI